MGHLLGQNPGVIGHQHVFLLLVLFALVSLASSLSFSKFTDKPPANAQNEQKNSV
jgi:hypothetical protein